MVYEARKQSTAWMETTYSKHRHFRWKIKWRLEHLDALGIMGETVPLSKGNVFPNKLSCDFLSYAYSICKIHEVITPQSFYPIIFPTVPKMPCARRGPPSDEKSLQTFCFTTDPIFVLGNAQILDNPIVYCSDGFCKMTGYKRPDVMKKNSDCSFLYGQLTDTNSVKMIHEALVQKIALQVEIIGYLRDGERVKKRCCYNRL